METDLGIRDDVLYVYDLELPADFMPVNSDGEIVHFELMPADRVVERVRTTDDFKFNVNLVILDFALRHGLIAVDDPEYHRRRDRPAPPAGLTNASRRSGSLRRRPRCEFSRRPAAAITCSAVIPDSRIARIVSALSRLARRRPCASVSSG